MPNAEGAFLTYETAIRKEDVSELIRMFRFVKPHLFHLLEWVLRNTLHEILTDEYASTTDNAQLEGSDPTYPTLSDPNRVKTSSNLESSTPTFLE